MVAVWVLVGVLQWGSANLGQTSLGEFTSAENCELAAKKMLQTHKFKRLDCIRTYREVADD